MAIGVEFINGASVEVIAGTVNRVEESIRKRFPEVGRIYIESRRVSREEAEPKPAPD